jgi:hypothetical protein
MFGVSGAATLTHQAVGPKEELPSRTVLEYPLKDMKLTAGDHEYTTRRRYMCRPGAADFDDLFAMP